MKQNLIRVEAEPENWDENEADEIRRFLAWMENVGREAMGLD